MLSPFHRILVEAGENKVVHIRFETRSGGIGPVYARRERRARIFFEKEDAGTP
jgi:hypothetical protein